MKFHIEDTVKMFGCGVLFGTAGIKILRSRDAKTPEQRASTPAAPRKRQRQSSKRPRQSNEMQNSQRN